MIQQPIGFRADIESASRLKPGIDRNKFNERNARIRALGQARSNVSLPALAPMTAASTQSQPMTQPAMLSQASAPAQPAPAQAPAQQAPAAPTRSYGNTVNDFMSIFRNAFYSPEKGETGPNRLQMAQRQALMDTIGYGGDLNKILSRATPAELQAAIAASRAAQPKPKKKGKK